MSGFLHCVGCSATQNVPVWQTLAVKLSLNWRKAPRCTSTSTVNTTCLISSSLTAERSGRSLNQHVTWSKTQQDTEFTLFQLESTNTAALILAELQLNYVTTAYKCLSYTTRTVQSEVCNHCCSQNKRQKLFRCSLWRRLKVKTSLLRSIHCSGCRMRWVKGSGSDFIRV